MGCLLGVRTFSFLLHGDGKGKYDRIIYITLYTRTYFSSCNIYIYRELQLIILNDFMD